MPDWYSFGPNLKLLAKMGLQGYMGQGSGVRAPGTDLPELKSYILSKMLWAPMTTDFGKVIGEFLHAYYGGGAIAVKNYMDVMTRSMKTEGYCRADEGQGITFPPTSPFLSPAALLESAAGFARGMRNVTTAKHRDRLLIASMSTRFVILVRWAELCRYADNHIIVWPLEPTKTGAYIKLLNAANISSKQNGAWFFFGGNDAGSEDDPPEAWNPKMNPFNTSGYLWQQVFNSTRRAADPLCDSWCSSAFGEPGRQEGPGACVCNWTSDKPCCDECGDHPVSNICLNDTRGRGSRGRAGIVTAPPSFSIAPVVAVGGPSPGPTSPPHNVFVKSDDVLVAATTLSALARYTIISTDNAADCATAIRASPKTSE